MKKLLVMLFSLKILLNLIFIFKNVGKKGQFFFVALRAALNTLFSTVFFACGADSIPDFSTLEFTPEFLSSGNSGVSYPRIFRKSYPRNPEFTPE